MPAESVRLKRNAKQPSKFPDSLKKADARHRPFLIQFFH